MKKLKANLKRTAKRLPKKSKSAFSKAWLDGVKISDLSMYASAGYGPGC